MSPSSPRLEASLRARCSSGATPLPPWRARRALAEGALGELWAVEMRILTSQLRYRRPSTNYLFRSEYAGSGILSWLCCHLLDLLSFITGDRIVEVTAMTGNQNPEPVDVEDTALVVFRMAGGAMGTLHAGYLMAGPGKNPDDSQIAPRGSRGYLQVPLATPWSPRGFDGDQSGLAYSMWSERREGRRAEQGTPPSTCPIRRYTGE